MGLPAGFKSEAPSLRRLGAPLTSLYLPRGVSELDPDLFELREMIDSHDGLEEHERAVLRLIVQGCPDVPRALGCDAETAQGWYLSLSRKLGISRWDDLEHLAFRLEIT